MQIHDRFRAQAQAVRVTERYPDRKVLRRGNTVLNEHISMTATAQQLEFLKNSIKAFRIAKPGILFRDVTNLLEDPKAYALSIGELLVERYKMQVSPKLWSAPKRVASCLAPVALGLGVGFVPVRKPRKLPR